MINLVVNLKNTMRSLHAKVEFFDFVIDYASLVKFLKKNDQNFNILHVYLFQCKLINLIFQV